MDGKKTCAQANFTVLHLSVGTKIEHPACVSKKRNKYKVQQDSLEFLRFQEKSCYEYEALPKSRQINLIQKAVVYSSVQVHSIDTYVSRFTFFAPGETGWWAFCPFTATLSTRYGCTVVAA